MNKTATAATEFASRPKMARKARSAEPRRVKVYGPGAAWWEAMRELKERLPSTLTPAEELKMALDAARDWLRYTKSWVKEIGVRIDDDGGVYFFVVEALPDKTCVQDLRDVAGLALTLGAVFRIPVRAALLSELPSESTSVITHANNKPAR